MNSIYIDGKELELDDDGFLKNQDEWSTDIASYFAKAENIEMTHYHWEIVNYLREYYKYYQVAPMVRVLVKEIGKKFGPEKGNIKYLYELFPGGPAKQACKIAGLPRPTGCI
ncbi:MAG TPA: TusE/DsrC/DsvC family sulfur relay protein [Nitrospirota bacterium]|nr:TusE/DsrC/DsvC family sulfur relay protein [Nitrospirota bacterium]